MNFIPQSTINYQDHIIQNIELANKIKCNRCHYLSIDPIFCCVNNNHSILYYCRACYDKEGCINPCPRNSKELPYTTLIIFNDVIIKCPTCLENVLYPNLYRHLQDCNNREIICPFKKCTSTIRMNSMQEHFKENHDFFVNSMNTNKIRNLESKLY